MKDNLDSKLILNRKFIIELRFTVVPKFLDLKGTILEKINSLKVINSINWSIGDTALKIIDSNNDEQARNIILAEMSRISYMSSQIDSIDKFFNDFSKLFNALKDILGILSIQRIGCRIQGTYKTKSNKYDDILKNFKESFPSNIFLEDFPTNDLRLQVVYQNGMYHIGPLKENDQFLQNEFKYVERVNSIGVALDTDNYLLNTDTENLDNISRIKDVFVASLAVEKNLVEKLKDF